MTVYHSIPYGSGEVVFPLPDEWRVETILPGNTPPLPDARMEIELAVDRWFASPQGKASLSGAQSAAIAVSDNTRPVPHDLLLPPLLGKLEAAGLQAERIMLLIATGTHPPMQAEDVSTILPVNILDRYPVASHHCDGGEEFAALGQTSRGTPVEINRSFIDADVRIVVGNIEPHHFMGFSGGVKTAAIGLASRRSIETNHALMFLPGSTIGVYAGNPIRQDLEEMGERLNIHLALNVVMNSSFEIVHVLAGSPREVMDAGVPLARAICQTEVPGRYDLVIASPGGHPKDINLYQAQKALTHASLITRDQGTVILAAACPEGSGSPGYEAFMQAAASLEDVFARTAQLGFKIGPHKAYQFARDLRRLKVILLSEMDSAFVDQLLLIPAGSPQTALQIARERVPAKPAVAILPKATQTIPIYEAA